MKNENLYEIEIEKMKLKDMHFFLQDNENISSFFSLAFQKEKKDLSDLLNFNKKGEIISYNRAAVEMPLVTPIDWNWNLKENRSINFHLQSWNMVEPLLLIYSQNQNILFLKKAKEVILDWISGDMSRSKSEKEEDFFWYDMAVGLRVYKLSYVIQQLVVRNIINDSEFDMLWGSFLKHISLLNNDSFIKYHNNHGLYQVGGQLLALRNLKNMNIYFKELSKTSLDRFFKILESQFTKEGVHKEHSPGYQYMVLNSLIRIEEAGVLNKERSIKNLLEKIKESLYYMTKQDGHLLNFGDTDHKINNLLPSFYFRSNSHLKIYKDSGLGVVKKGNGSNASYLAIQAAFHSRAHKHADDLSFIWLDKGVDILIDPGAYCYKGKTEVGSEDWENGFWYSDKKRQYIEKTRAHNTIEIDGRDFLRKGRKPFGSAIEQFGVFDGIYCIKTHVYQFKSIRHARSWIFSPNNWLLVLDWLLDKKEEDHNFKQWFHFPENANINKCTSSIFKISIEDASLWCVDLCKKQNSTQIISGQKNPYYQGWSSIGKERFVESPAFAFQDENKASSSFATLFTFGDFNLNNFDAKINNSGRGFILSWFQDGQMYKVFYKCPKNDKLSLIYEKNNI